MSGDVIATSLRVDQGGQSAAVAISAVSAQTAPLQAGSVVVVTPSVDCFVRAGTNPTALADGTDLFLVGGNTYRLRLPQITSVKLAFITPAASGTAYITPGA